MKTERNNRMTDAHAYLRQREIWHIRLTPKAAHNRIGDLVQLATGQEVLKVTVTAVPEDGKANAALLALLAKELKIAKSALTLSSGHTSRNKVVKREE